MAASLCPSWSCPTCISLRARVKRQLAPSWLGTRPFQHAATDAELLGHESQQPVLPSSSPFVGPWFFDTRDSYSPYVMSAVSMRACQLWRPRSASLCPCLSLSSLVFRPAKDGTGPSPALTLERSARAQYGRQFSIHEMHSLARTAQIPFEWRDTNRPELPPLTRPR